jgi:hypothetical protein
MLKGINITENAQALVSFKNICPLLFPTSR